MAKKIFRCGPIMTLFSTQRNINYFRTNNGNPFALKSVLNYFKIDTHKLPLKCCARFPQTIQFSSNDRNEQCLVSISVVQCSENESSDFAATAGSHSSRKCTAIFHELRLPTPTKAFAPFSQECFGQRTTPSPAAIQRTTPHPGRTTARQGMTTTRPKTTTRPRTTTKPVQSAKLVSVSPAGKTTPRGSPVKPAVVASPVVAVAGKAQTTRTTPKSNVKATTPARAVAVSVRTTSRQLTTIRTTLRTTPKNSKLVDARGTTQRTTTKTPTYSPTKLRSPPARPITTTMTNHPAGRTSTTSKPPTRSTPGFQNFVDIVTPPWWSSENTNERSSSIMLRGLPRDMPFFSEPPGNDSWIPPPQPEWYLDSEEAAYQDDDDGEGRNQTLTGVDVPSDVITELPRVALDNGTTTTVEGGTESGLAVETSTTAMQRSTTKPLLRRRKTTPLANTESPQRVLKRRKVLVTTTMAASVA
ncbi:mucin-2 isoform X3 [Aedes albopictus]|uniref:Uncharacterized protein n=1 Tax=Aedes albopictus TaxID=7160 RepID=A0ABM1YDV4_AEDAL